MESRMVSLFELKYAHDSAGPTTSFRMVTSLALVRQAWRESLFSECQGACRVL